MPTKHPRINVVFEPPLYESLVDMAKKDHVSLSLKVRDLVREAMELYEDKSLATLAEQREQSFDKRRARTHNQIWKLKKK